MSIILISIKGRINQEVFDHIWKLVRFWLVNGTTVQGKWHMRIYFFKGENLLGLLGSYVLIIGLIVGGV